ncbi:hypothetical protein ZHAS_00009016 [Anopheles sinensis]|uniref:Uncharacterized protein n=1 Tax=Anopheles sinensis TaxID=74873 RepID=A0A084VTY7_ANOSI|nr:hypothetical protein ZHAS_00009016 [Anopheles sinensis]
MENLFHQPTNSANHTLYSPFFAFASKAGLAKGTTVRRSLADGPNPSASFSSLVAWFRSERLGPGCSDRNETTFWLPRQFVGHGGPYLELIRPSRVWENGSSGSTNGGFGLEL